MIDCKKTIENIRKELTEYIQKWNIKALVLGVSGGIDSALTTVLAEPVCHELGIALIGASMPIESNKPEEVDRARCLGDAFDLIFIEKDLTQKYLNNKEFIREMEELIRLAADQKEKIIIPDMNDKAVKIRNGNIKARIRMKCLYNLSNAYHGIVLSTDNYTEYMLGFWTLHGDCGDYGMIQNLWKTEVYALARCLVAEYREQGYITKADALDACIGAVVTDGLGVSSNSLEQIGAASYDEVDALLQAYLRGECQDVNHPVIQRHLNSAYKRNNPYNVPRDCIYVECDLPTE